MILVTDFMNYSTTVLFYYFHPTEKETEFRMLPALSHGPFVSNLNLDVNCVSVK